MSVKKTVATAVAVLALAAGCAKEGTAQKTGKANKVSYTKEQIAQIKQKLPDWMPVTEDGSLDTAAIDQRLKAINLKENESRINKYIDAVKDGEIGDKAFLAMVDGIAKKNEQLRQDLLTQQDVFKKVADTKFRSQQDTRKLLTMAVLLSVIGINSIRKTKASSKKDSYSNEVFMESIVSALATFSVGWCVGDAILVNKRTGGIEEQVKNAYVQLYDKYTAPSTEAHGMSDVAARKVIDQARTK